MTPLCLCRLAPGVLPARSTRSLPVAAEREHLSPNEENDDEVEVISAKRWSWLNPAILGTVVVAEIAQSVSDFFTGVATLMASHSTWEQEREKFREEASLAIERITAE